MNNNKAWQLLESLSNIKEEFILEAAPNEKAKPRITWLKVLPAVATAAACLLIVIFAVSRFGINQDLNTKSQTGSERQIMEDSTGASVAEEPTAEAPGAEPDDGEADSSEMVLEGMLMDVTFPEALVYDDFEAYLKLFEDNPVGERFLSAVNGFSYKTTAQILANSNENINYSPLSLYYALALAASGADGETAEELFSVLGVSDAATLSAQCGNLYRQIFRDNEIAEIRIANSLWMDKDVKWKNDFITNAAENFYASSYSMDFSDKTTGEAMAAWIAQNTNGTLTPEIEIGGEQILSILNTIYFYAQWTDDFDEEATVEDIFTLEDSSTVNCDFMNRPFSFGSFGFGDRFTRSSLGLRNGGSMIFILPNEGVSPRELLSSPEKVQEVFEVEEPNFGEVVWQIPKFSFGSKLDLRDTIEKLGVSSSFEKTANFSKITNDMAFISDIHQETHIGIDEKGVEASAYTDISMSGSAMPKGKAEMILNRPFIYGITASNGTLLFVGICDNPNMS